MTHLPRRALAALSLLVLALVAASGCSEDGGGRDTIGPSRIYSSIVISGPDTVLIDSLAAFTAVVLDTAGQLVANPELTWTTSNPAIATVNNAGVVRGVSEGDVTIRALGGGMFSNLEFVAVIEGRGWVDQSDVVDRLVELNGVSFVSARRGVVVGDLGTILLTADAGRTWSAVASNSTNYTLEDVAFATTSIGIIVGGAGRILRTTNGGASWTVMLGVDTDGGKGLNDVHFQDANRGWIVGNAGLILRTDNGGASWTRVLPGVTTNDLQSVSFPRNTSFATPPADPYGRGWIAGDVGTLLYSEDFGQSWAIYTPSITTDPLFGVARGISARAIAVGSNNRVAVADQIADDPEWTLALPPVPFSNLKSVAWPSFAAPAPAPAWAVGKSVAGAIPVVFRSDDEGESWTPQDLPTDAPLAGNGLNDVFFLDDRRGWAVGTQGLVLHTVTGGR